MGDSSGNIYRMEGSGSSGDGGTSSIDTNWTSKVFSMPLDAEAFDVIGYIKYKKNVAATVTLTFLAAGKTAFDQAITITSRPSRTSITGAARITGESKYWGAAFQNRLIRQAFDAPGQMADFQVKVDVTGTGDFNINEIGLRFKAAS
jgi:hypothetical protein